MVKGNDKEKYAYSGYGTAFNEKGSWSFNNDFARNFIVFGDDNGSSSHAENFRNNVLILGEGDTFGINGSFSAPGKKLILILVKQRQNFA